jgi:hypothetical protein
MAVKLPTLNPGGPLNNKRAYWDFGKYVHERLQEGSRLKDVTTELEEQAKKYNMRYPNESLLSRLKTAYKTYVLEFGIPLEELEHVSAYDMWKAHKLKYARNRKEARELIARLKGGESFRSIQKSRGDL